MVYTAQYIRSKPIRDGDKPLYPSGDRALKVLGREFATEHDARQAVWRHAGRALPFRPVTNFDGDQQLAVRVRTGDRETCYIIAEVQ